MMSRIVLGDFENEIGILHLQITFGYDEDCGDDYCDGCEICTPICGIVFSVNDTVYQAWGLKPMSELEVAKINGLNARVNELNGEEEVNE